MEHLSDKQLLAAWKQQDSKGSALKNHLPGCVSCRQRLSELQATWDALGHWTVEMPDIDLTDRIMHEARPVRTVRLWQTQTLMRIAASVLIGVGLGLLLGRPILGPVSEHQVAQAMYLDALALDSATGWTAPLLSGSEEP